ncbi:hypothetical protein QUH73_20265 [Labilibaculum sp. K2S]|uniref:hypothetical protein n=1 Tax=Labilibaculum sp. K2S TaxID=3056386 RepID=UPI0025A487EC|nr:hypothetical protein [Labilibaculum sp. K2S]MDM8162164.1 hypothetical protein [Labilibaculum sp. K2S]
MKELINCSGVIVDYVSIPSFKLNEGEYLTFEIPFNYDSSSEELLIDVLRGNIIIDGFKGNSEFEFVEDIVVKRGLFSWCKNYTSFKYLNRNTDFKMDEIDETLKKLNISKSDRIWKLGFNERKSLSFEIARSKSKLVIINTMGMDYTGLQILRYRFGNYLNRGFTIIELNYRTNKGFDSFEDSKIIRLVSVGDNKKT